MDARVGLCKLINAHCSYVIEKSSDTSSPVADLGGF